MQKYLAVGMGRLMKYELNRLCSRQANSILRSRNRSDVINFPWVQVLEEVNEHCPLLLRFLNAITATKKIRSNHLHFMVTIVCLMVKYKNSHMSLFQKLVSSILYAGHSGTIVYTRLQKLSISVSKNAMYSLLDCLSNGHDSLVKKWQSSLSPVEVL